MRPLLLFFSQRSISTMCGGLLLLLAVLLSSGLLIRPKEVTAASVSHVRASSSHWARAHPQQVPPIQKQVRSSARATASGSRSAPAVRSVWAELGGVNYTFEVPVACRGDEVEQSSLKTPLAVLVNSPGGVGTTHMLKRLIEHYHVVANNAHDADHLKHFPRPPSVRSLYAHLGPPSRIDDDDNNNNNIDNNNNHDTIALSSASALSARSKRIPFRVVYVFDQPVTAVASHFRRGWWRNQARKLTGNTCSLPDLGRTAAARQKTKQDAWITQLQAYARLGQDLFRLEECLHRWLLEDSAYDRILVNGAYQDHLFEPLQQLLAMERLPARLPVWSKHHLEEHQHHPLPLDRQDKARLDRIYRQSS
eukprot:CAMPEP_0174234222 /NCGR_PEP_ID=MMETSP0417-20130205/4037_1 /TAXON_ID=242541 /ORGANISM="Mayorella sp, Strain BSH-02190019" /LENGTH=363 /DNA_ID=CAMNT_0015312557 /DNA_START=22 /DNA_END=1110 /DNA_ORIENTATION=+